MSLATVRQALSDAADTVTGWRSTPYIPDQIHPPQFVVGGPAIDYDLTMGRGADAWNFTITAFVSRAAEKQAQQALDEVCEPSGATSLKTVVEANAALHNLVDYARVRSATRPQVATIGQVDYIAVDFEVEVVY